MISQEFRDRLAQKQENVRDFFEFANCKIGRGTYGHVYKATSKNKKKFPEESYALKLNEGQGTSTSLIREISLLRELEHEHLIKLLRVFFNYREKQIWLLMDYAEHDLYHIIRFHRNAKVKKTPVIVPKSMIKSILYQILDGMQFLHSQWVMHRDLKPANILLYGEGPPEKRGRIKIGDMGFARVFKDPLRPLAEIDPVVVTFWYRSPELLLGAKHYTEHVDVWAIGCIFAELLTSEPIFFCNNEDIKAQTPYHLDQLKRIFIIMGFPTDAEWPHFQHMPDYHRLMGDLRKSPQSFGNCSLSRYLQKHEIGKETQQFKLLAKLLTMDVNKRINCQQALLDPYFTSDPRPTKDVFNSHEIPYPKREYMPENQAEKLIEEHLNQMNPGTIVLDATPKKRPREKESSKAVERAKKLTLKLPGLDHFGTQPHIAEALLRRVRSPVEMPKDYHPVLEERMKILIKQMADEAEQKEKALDDSSAIQMEPPVLEVGYEAFPSMNMNQSAQQMGFAQTSYAPPILEDQRMQEPIFPPSAYGHNPFSGHPGNHMGPAQMVYGQNPQSGHQMGYRWSQSGGQMGPGMGSSTSSSGYYAQPMNPQMNAMMMPPAYNQHMMNPNQAAAMMHQHRTSNPPSYRRDPAQGPSHNRDPTQGPSNSQWGGY